MEPSIEKIRERYQRMTDEDLIKLATEEASGLREEAKEVLLEEMAQRNLSVEVLKGMQMQMGPVKAEVLLASAEFIRHQSCPYCNSTNRKLNAALVATAVGALLIYSYKVELVIACPACLDKKHTEANTTTATLGWWGMPGGLYKPFQAFSLNNKQRKHNHQEGPTMELLAFTKQNLGKIHAYEKQPEALRDMLKTARFK